MQAYCHLATPAGRGGICLLHLWGGEEELRRVDGLLPAGRRLAAGATLPPGTVAYGWLHDPDGQRLDEVLLTVPAAGQRLISGHGGRAGALALLDFFVALGFQEQKSGPAMGLPGGDFPPDGSPDELEGMLADCKTEAQAALVLAALNGMTVGRERLRAALQPRRIALCGAPNAGKSSLLNRLADEERCLVSPYAGTTLDAVEHWLDLGGWHCALVDTAGFRCPCPASGADAEGWAAAEAEAIRRGEEQIRRADVLLLVADASRLLDAEGYRAVSICSAAAADGAAVVIALNKADLPARIDREELRRFFPRAAQVPTCGLPGDATDGGAGSPPGGLRDLPAALIAALGGPL